MKQFLELYIDKNLEQKIRDAINQDSPNKALYQDLNVPYQKSASFQIHVSDPDYDIVQYIRHENIIVSIDGNIAITVEIQPTDHHYGVIPLSVLHDGITCTIGHGYSRDVLGNVFINRRWFEPATSETWKNLPMPDSTKIKLAYNRDISENEYKRIQLGLTPFQMEDKWFAYFKDQVLYAYRSWTGLAVLQAHIQNVNNTYQTTDVWFNTEFTGNFTPTEMVDIVFDHFKYGAKIFE